MKILGIETSCDETAAAVVEDGKVLLSNIVASSMDIHVKYGGVVPEIAARSHIEVINQVIEESLQQANCSWEDIDGIAVTYGAGLGGSLLIGVMAARTLAITKNKPLYSANHVLGHVFANFLNSSPLTNYSFPTNEPELPILAVIVSGGHTQLVLFRDYFDYTILGRTQDDAIGEAFDKVAKVLGLDYPGGPAISKIAKNGDSFAYDFPIPKMAGYDFSFSGLKTAVLRRSQELIGKDYTFPSFAVSTHLNEAQKADIAASFERVACLSIAKKVRQAIQEYMPASVVLAGGVAANNVLRDQLEENLGLPLIYPDLKLCTDNGAMIAALGCYMAEQSNEKADPYSLDIAPNLTM